MASGKFRKPEHDRILLDAGLHANYLNPGVVGTVHHFHGGGFHLNLPSGECRSFIFSEGLRAEKLQQWKFVLDKCYATSIPLRVLGAFQFNENTWILNKHSLLLRQPAVLRQDELRLYEAFCGGFGGFGRAINFINGHSKQRPFEHVGGFDYDSAACHIHDLNHGIRAQQFEARTPELWEQMSTCDIGILALTAPCISFSLAGLQQGWSGDGARAFSLMLYIAALLGIPVLIIENVANLLENPEFKEGLMNRLKSNGYSCIMHHAFAAVKFLPIHRNRLILIAFFNKQKIGHLDDWRLNPKIDTTWNVKRNDAFLMSLPPVLHKDVQVEPDVLVEYAKISRMPTNFLKNFKHQEGCRRSPCSCEVKPENLLLRCWDGVEPLGSGTMMASYTNQHRIPGCILGQLVNDSNGVRFVHPCEIAINSGITGKLVLPREIGLGAKIIGNCITEFHALIPLLVLLQEWPLGGIRKAFHCNIESWLALFQKCCMNMGNLQLHFDHSWIYISSDECADIIDMNPDMSRKIIMIQLHDTDRNCYEDAPNLVVDPSATVREILRALDELACRKIHHSMKTVDGQSFELDDWIPEECQQVIVETCAGLPTKDIVIRIGQNFAFSIPREDLLTFGDVVMNGSDVDSIRWYNQHGTHCSFQARDDISNLVTEEVDINQQPPLILYDNPRIGIILQIVHRRMTSIDVDFIIEFVPFVDPARIGTLVNAQIDFYSVTGELGAIVDKHGATLSNEMMCLNGMIVRQTIHVDDDLIQENNSQPCYSLIVIGLLQFPVPTMFLQKHHQMVEIRSIPIHKLPMNVATSDVTTYTLQNDHPWNAQSANNTAFVVEYRVDDETLSIEYHEVVVHGMTTAAQILAAHQLMQPNDGWTLFTDKHGQELTSDYIVEVGDTIGLIDNIATDVKSTPISPTIPYCVIEESNGPRPVADRAQGQIKQIAEQIEAKRFTLNNIPECFVLNPSAARIWQTMTHGPPIAKDEMAFYISCLTEGTNIQSLGIVTSEELFSEISINEIASGKENQLMAVMIANHWRLLSVHKQHLHWFYSVSSCEGLELHHKITTIIDHLLPAGFESFTHLGTGIHGWCGWDALEAWTQFQNIRLEPDHEPIRPPLHQQVPAQWNKYHEAMTDHPVLSTQELALILRTKWFKQVTARTTDFLLNENPLGFGRDDASIKGKITGLMISKGHEAADAIKIATQICKIQLGPKDINALMSKKQSVSYPALQQICKANDIEIKGGEEHAVRKLQRFFRSKVSGKSKPVQSLDLAMLVIPSGVFSVEGKPVQVNRTWGPNSQGLSIATKSQIQPFLDQGQRLTAGCCSVILAEHIVVSNPFSIDQHVINVKDHWNGEALIRVNVVHLGDIKATRTPITEVKVEADTGIDLQVAVHHEHLLEPQWSDLMNGPVKMLLRTLNPDNSLVVQHVGFRRWTLKRSRSVPDNADYFAVTVTVKQSEVQQWLKRSGLTTPPIFVSPRMLGTEADNQYRILWMGRDGGLAAAIAATPKVIDHCGVVYKAPSFGIRVVKARYQSAYSELKPGSSYKPNPVSTPKHFLLQGMPKNLHQGSLQEISQELKWGFRMLKKRANGDMIVGAETEPPTSTLLVNGAEVLLTKLETATKITPTLVAGRLRGANKDAKDGEHTPSSTTTANSWTQPMPVQLNSGVSPTLLSVSDDAAMKQSQRLTVLEAQVDELKQQMEADRGHIQQQFEQVEEKIETVSTDLSLSLKAALDQQSKDLMHSFSKLMSKGNSTPNSGKRERSRSPMQCT